MTYTRFEVSHSPRSSAQVGKRNTPQVFFDASENAFTSRKRKRRAYRAEKRFRRRRRVSLFFGALGIFTLALCAVLVLSGIVTVETGGDKSVLTFDLSVIADAISDLRGEKDSTPSFNTVSSYYLKLRDGKSGSINSANPVEGSESDVEDKDSAVAVDSDLSSEAVSADGENTFPLVSLDLSGNTDGDGKVISSPSVRINNETSYTVDIEESLRRDYPISPITPFEDMENPKVLVIHTHGTEAFTASDGSFYYKSEITPRSTDTSRNVVALGKKLTEALNGMGISTIHCDTMHDEKSFLTAYKSAAESIEKYLSEYPGIMYVIDLHRDSIIRTDNRKVKPVTTIGGKKTAQIMFVVGTDGGGAKHDNWRENLDAVLHIQELILSDYPTLVRPVNLRDSRFNGQYTTGSVILEVGSCGNTFEEASNAVTLFASAFARTVSR